MSVGVRIIADIPDPLLDDIGSNLQDYFVPILGLADERCPEPPRLLGSGTLVKIGSSYHILTAAHVWEDPKSSPGVGLLLTSYLSRLVIPREAIVPHTLRGRGPKGFGPDLALLTIPPPFVPEIKAHKSILDLSQQRNKYLANPSRPDSGLWAVIGMVEQFSSVQQHPEQRVYEVEVHGRAFFSGIDKTHQRNGYDYLDVGADMSLAAVPSSFGGVSGGALWWIVLSENKTGQIWWSGKRYFYGVAFWQSPIRQARRVIRCHGPKSLFEKAWKKWRLPN